MSDLSVTVTPGYTFVAGELVTIEKLNALSGPTVLLSGSIGALVLADGSVTTPKLATGVLSNDVTGRSKMADGYLSADATGRAKMAANYISADATGRAFMQPGYFTADATGQGKFANGFLTNDSNGRTLMADGYFTADDTATTGGRAKFAAGFVTFAKLATGVAPQNSNFGRAYNVLVKNNAAVGKMDFTADELMMVDPTGLSYKFLGGAATVTGFDITVPQNLNGRDTATGLAATWYYIWIITDGTNVRAVYSQSFAHATVETNLRASGNFTGYSAKALVGFCKCTNAGTGAIMSIQVRDRAYSFPETQLFTNTAPALADTYQTLDAGALVPDIAKTATGNMGTSTNSGGCIAVAGDGNGFGACTLSGAARGSAFNGFWCSCPFAVPVIAGTPHTVYWQAHTATTDYRLTFTGGTW